MKKSIFVPFCFALLVFSYGVFAQKPGAKSAVTFYHGTYDDFLREARQQKKIAILDFWASWCGPCQKMDKETFNDPQLGNFVNKNYLVYKVNIDTFDGMEIANRFGVDVFPTTVVLNSRGRLLDTWQGFFPANVFQQKLIDLKGKPAVLTSL